MKLYKIKENDAFQRLDKFLKKLFPNATRGLIYKLNRKEKIKVKSEGDHEKFRKKDNEYKLSPGDELKIFLSENDIRDLQKKDSGANSIKKHDNSNVFCKKDIVYEDASILIINKKPGINVHPGQHKTKEVSLIQVVHDYYSGRLDSLTFRPSLVHRIDRNTSGILLIAKTKEMLTKLVGDFKEHKNLKKTYYAIVVGKLVRKSGTIKKKLLRIEGAKDENKVQVSPKGKEAISHYSLIKEYIIQGSEGNIILSEVEIEIDTGRMHQIRVHMASIGNPILGDDVYGDKKLNSYFKRKFGLIRQALHAWKIEFFHHKKKKKVFFQSHISNDLQNFLSNIK